MNRHFVIFSAALCVLLSNQCFAAEPAATAWQVPFTAEQLDRTAFAQWVDGQESPVAAEQAKNGPRDLCWTNQGRIEWRGVEFGESRTAGPRHLRVGFTQAVPVGSVLVRGGGQLSVLKPTAKYPGNLTDDSQWLPAERLSNRQVTQTEVSREEFAVWVLPSGTTTQALRFTHVGDAADRDLAGWVGGVWVLPQRLANLAPQAVVSASAQPEAADRLNDESNNRTWQTWSNGEKGNERPISAENQEWILLAWPKPVKLQALCFLFAGFSGADIEAFTGPANVAPGSAPAEQWKKVATAKGLEALYPIQLGPNWVGFEQPVETRALRVRVTAAAISGHPHLSDKVKEQRRIWLGELLALSPLEARGLDSVILPQAAEIPPPIPVRFKLPEAGLVTLVIEDAQGKRIRNLVSETPFPAGDNVAWWDGSDDLGRDVGAAKHGLYHVPTQFVAPGKYSVRGLWRKPLKLVYEQSVYSPGRPPWETADGTGCWMTNHTPPTSLAVVPAARGPQGKPLVLMGAYVAEGGHGLQWVQEDGTKLGGQGWVGGVWTGAPTLAVDGGPQAVPEHLAYVASIWEGELRLTAKTTALQDKPVLKQKLGDDPAPDKLKPEQRPAVLKEFDGGDRQFVLSGLAVRDGVLVCALPRQNELLFVDARQGKLLGKATVENPRGLTFAADGQLLVLSGKQLLRFAALKPGEPQASITAGKVLVKDLEDPRHVTLDAAGKIYISDRGQSHQVKVFTADGKPAGTIGKAGVPANGTYDPLRMNNPNGLAIDTQGRLWVAENDFHPKRVSIWSTAGKLVKAYYGPSEYGGGGVLDSRDPTKFFYKGQEFKLDWKTGTNELVRVFYRPLDLLHAHYGHYSPDTPLYPAARPGARYFTSCYTHNPTNGSSAAFVWLDAPQAARLLAGVGNAHDWKILQTEAFASRWPEGLKPTGDRWKNLALFSWSDQNGDGEPQPEEVQIVKATSTGGVTFMDDLSAVISNWDGRAVKFTPQSFTKEGAPQYDLTKAEVLVEGAQRAASSGGEQAITDPEGWTVLTNAPQPYSNYGLGGVYKGEPKWSYPSMWPGLHASHEAAVPDRPGMVVGHTRLLGGWVKPSGDAGKLFCINGNMGNMYLLSADGLFVATLFNDIRLRPNWAMPQAVRGMDVTNVSLHDENFWPSITQTSDGKIYLVDGGRTSLVRVDGLDSIRRLPAQPLTVTTDDLAKAQSWFAAAEIARQAAAVREPWQIVMRERAPNVDGDLKDWPVATQWAVIDRRGTRANFNSDSKPYDASAAACVSDGRLFVAFRTAEKDLLANSGATPNALFKTGGCLDVMLATAPDADPQRGKPVAGDLRLLVTLVNKTPRALLYRAVVPGTKEPVAFSSPWRTITLDTVTDVSEHVKLAGNGEGHFELSVPLTVLDWHPLFGTTFSGDVGLLRGNGFQTLQRVYWSNKATSITSDVPSEAELTPKLWGELRIVNESK